MAEQTKRPYRRAADTRRHVLDVAARLFYAEGIHAVGIDRVAAEAQVTTATLYRLFGSKDGLVTAYLRHADEDWFRRLEGAEDVAGLIRFFDELDDMARDPGHRGCAFRLAMTEYPALDCEVSCLAVDNRRRTCEHFRQVLAQSGHPDPQGTAEKLMLILDGIEASAAGRGPESGPGPGPSLVRLLLLQQPVPA